MKGQIRNTFDTGTRRAVADFTGENGRPHKFKPKPEANCPKGHKGKDTNAEHRVG